MSLTFSKWPWSIQHAQIHLRGNKSRYPTLLPEKVLIWLFLICDHLLYLSRSVSHQKFNGCQWTQWSLSISGSPVLSSQKVLLAFFKSYLSLVRIFGRVFTKVSRSYQPPKLSYWFRLAHLLLDLIILIMLKKRLKIVQAKQLFIKIPGNWKLTFPNFVH